uniref:Ig-like domain-containing protein n=1 Tax=Oreochromis niloticus TaxID=8128 RepID=A0A669DVR1_ORENI
MTCSVFLLHLFCIFVFPLLGQTTITAESGQNISLPCQVPANNEQILAVQWSRADLKQEYVILYRDEVFVPDNQHPSFKNRVDLQDRQMKDGDVSLILKNVTFNDTGTYECRVFRRGTNHRISTITLSVVPPGESVEGSFVIKSFDRNIRALFICLVRTQIFQLHRLTLQFYMCTFLGGKLQSI